MRSRVLFSLAAFLAASAWCVVLLRLRQYEYGEARYGYLVSNLALAWIPLLLAGLLVAAYSQRRPVAELLVIGLAWLVFLPNAPYVLTDFIHLGPDHRQFDAILLASFAFTSLALGFASLLLVQLMVTRAAGAALGWFVALSSLLAASVGIYLGRVLRLNSWDVVQRPGRLTGLVRDRLDDPFGNRHLIGFVVVLCGFLTLAYCGLYGLTAIAASARSDRR
jgi:uncharacterized membrane protein